MTAPLKTSTVRPGLLVTLKTSITGNMKYSSTTIDNKLLDDGAKFTKWEGTCTVADPAEHERATKVRSNASGYIIAACAYTAFGLLCPDDKIEKFKEAWAKAREEVDEFNSTAVYSYIRLYVMVGRIAANDAEALESIAGEVQNLIRTMEDGVKNADVKRIRDAALAARQLGSMLTDSAREKVQQSIELARAAASKYAKAGEAAAKEIDLETVKQLAARRSAFLDLSGIAEIKAPVKANRRAVELPKTVTKEEYVKLEEAGVTPLKLKQKAPPKIEVTEKDLGDIPAPVTSRRRAVRKLEGIDEETVAAGAKVIDAVNKIADSGETNAAKAIKKLAAAGARAPKPSKAKGKKARGNSATVNT